MSEQILHLLRVGDYLSTSEVALALLVSEGYAEKLLISLWLDSQVQRKAPGAPVWQLVRTYPI